MAWAVQRGTPPRDTTPVVCSFLCCLPTLHASLGTAACSRKESGTRGPVTLGPRSAPCARSAPVRGRNGSRRSSRWLRADTRLEASSLGIEAQGLVTWPLHVRSMRHLPSTTALIARRHWQHRPPVTTRAQSRRCGEGNARCGQPDAQGAGSAAKKEAHTGVRVAGATRTLNTISASYCADGFSGRRFTMHLHALEAGADERLRMLAHSADRGSVRCSIALMKRGPGLR